MKLFRIFIAIVVFILNYSCEDFLERTPKDELSIESTFSNYNTIKAYAWNFYNDFLGYGTGGNPSFIQEEFSTDLMARSRRNAYSPWIWQTVEIPATDVANYSQPFEGIRRCNIMIDNIDQSGISESEKNHWRSVAYFFKAYYYMDLVNKYGDITWVENTLKDDDDTILYGPRTSRDIVAANILELLEYAENNINPDGNINVDGENTINVHVVRALISRFGIREGTWRKYHGLSGSETYLSAAISSSEKLIEAYPNIMADYSKVYCSESLAGADGIILYTQYEESVLGHTFGWYPGSSNGYCDLTRKAIDMYLMKDGQTRWTSPMFEGEYPYNNEFRNRDLRLYYTTPPPYKIIGPGVTTNWDYTDTPSDREFIDIMDTLSTDGSKGLPMRAWSGPVVQKVPHFSDNNYGQTWSITLTGYQYSKLFTRLNEGLRPCINDSPVFRMGEVLLNYAEAKMELGDFNQDICDATINKLRARGGVASLDILNIPDDPTRDPLVDPVLWEIRRERAVELMGDGFRFNDLRRWKKMDYATERKLGKYIVAAEENNKVPILNGASEGYAAYEEQPPTPFLEHYYLYPIPTNEITLSQGQIKQNPGW
ncbi:RagB/SusD family nutrient uptake outer membrane protein [Membranihabitans maritimus]|uniref:RagB/SusD family nutrient uptake outer membrane protein n=1 Tax=Membranihabitans maritimus TaxID=2904244 RepID=UPI001F478247|nr:RagB/SusD family nutrient uptake outer membrane protein [Membranihabitans maritimus]